MADAPGLAALAPWEGRVKMVPFDEANVSAARNAGLAAAAGEVVAFLDDDAVAECARRFKTYDPQTQTYAVRRGVRRSCP